MEFLYVQNLLICIANSILSLAEARDGKPSFLRERIAQRINCILDPEPGSSKGQGYELLLRKCIP